MTEDNPWGQVGRKILDAIDLLRYQPFKRGLGIIGPAGVGKTTMIKYFLRHLIPDDHQVVSTCSVAGLRGSVKEKRNSKESSLSVPLPLKKQYTFFSDFTSAISGRDRDEIISMFCQLIDGYVSISLLKFADVELDDDSEDLAQDYGISFSSGEYDEGGVMSYSYNGAIIWAATNRIEEDSKVKATDEFLSRFEIIRLTDKDSQYLYDYIIDHGTYSDNGNPHFIIPEPWKDYLKLCMPQKYKNPRFLEMIVKKGLANKARAQREIVNEEDWVVAFNAFFQRLKISARDEVIIHLSEKGFSPEEIANWTLLSLKTIKYKIEKNKEKPKPKRRMKREFSKNKSESIKDSN